METLKVVTETNIVQTEPAVGAAGAAADAKYKVVAPESMHETFLSDSEDEGGKSKAYLRIFGGVFVLFLCGNCMRLPL